MAYNSTDWTTDALTKAGSAGTNTVGGVTLYANFSVGQVEATTFVINTHTAIPFQNANYSHSAYAPIFGTSTDPATTFTTADSNKERASDLVMCLWYVHDNIIIDSVVSIEGADAATGDTTRMHLMSYDFTSGSSSALTNGTVLASSSDITNDGSEQAYKSSWSINSESVASGKVILAMFRCDSISSDYAMQISVKYHLS